MPELPEVETIRMGLDTHLTGRGIERVDVLHPRAVRRHPGGGADLSSRLAGKRIDEVCRRGKYLWLRTSDRSDEAAAVVHLGMSGQLLIADAGAPDPTHLRLRLHLDGEESGAHGSGSRGSGGRGSGGRELRFVDQRTFGGWQLSDYIEVGGVMLPAPIAHIAPDPFDPAYDPERAVHALRSRSTEVKRALLDQTVVSGIGNIYADEALWQARLHGRRRCRGLSKAQAGELLAAATDVMAQAITVGGTSFDALYVNVNGESGYFDRSLNAYGREGRGCRRCGTLIVRESFMNRSSYFCPQCQRPPGVRKLRR